MVVSQNSYWWPQKEYRNPSNQSIFILSSYSPNSFSKRWIPVAVTFHFRITWQDRHQTECEAKSQDHSTTRMSCLHRSCKNGSWQPRCTQILYNSSSGELTTYWDRAGPVGVQARSNPMREQYQWNPLGLSRWEQKKAVSFILVSVIGSRT